MKSELLTLLALVLLVGTSCQEKIDLQKEKEAIIAVIEKERDSFTNRDLNQMNDTWLQTSFSRKVDICKYCGTVEYVGWGEINKKNEGYFKSSRRETDNELTVQFYDYDINVIENTALVYFNATWSGKYKGEEFHLEDKRIIHLRKTEGEWKMDMYVHYTLPEEESVAEES